MPKSTDLAQSIMPSKMTDFYTVLEDTMQIAATINLNKLGVVWFNDVWAHAIG